MPDAKTLTRQDAKAPGRCAPDFVGATEQGKNALWRYLGGFLTVLVFWLVLGSVPLLLSALWAQLDGDPATMLDPNTGTLTGIDPIVGGYLLPNLSFPIFLVGLVVAVRLFHGRGVRTLVTPRSSIRWRRVWDGFGLWLLLAAVAAVVEIALYPRAFTWRDVSLWRYLGFLVLALVLTPIQTSAEELLFRGYLLQATGRLVRARWVLALINGALFAAPHFANPEVARDPVLLMVYYAGLGAFFAWLTLHDGTAELALGAHAANNLFVVLLVNYEGSALWTPALVLSTRFDPVFNLLTFAASALTFGLVVLRARRTDAA
ncbi:MAG: CPBP family intramembrane metalloprotease [Anaerolineae bacterium]|jgi:hypothetical protein|nr:CPBP family intramembrane metalloprotease [Anaerolineae bacterium]